MSQRPATGSSLRVLALAAAALLVTVALAMETVQTVREVDAGRVGFDFHGTVLEPARAIVRGETPYPSPNAREVATGNPALYPPLAFVLGLPFAPLGDGLATVAWSALLVAILALSLAILGVTDWRCCALAFLSYPGRTGLLFGNVAVLLVGLVAVAWRARHRAIVCGAAVGLGIALKLVLWPLLFWLLATRRFKALAAASACAALGIGVPWTAIGLDGLSTYSELLGVASVEYAGRGYSVTGMALWLGLDIDGARIAALACGAVVVSLAVVVGRRGDELASFSMALFAGIVASPIVWPYSYLVLVIPLAVARPRLSPAWLLLPAMIVAEYVLQPPGWQPLVLTGIAAAIAVVPLRAGLRHVPQVSGASQMRPQRAAS